MYKDFVIVTDVPDTPIDIESRAASELLAIVGASWRDDSEDRVEVVTACTADEEVLGEATGKT